MDHLYVDRRIGGVERWVYGEPRDALMRVSDLLTHCPVFLCVKKDGGAEIMAGTGFFIGIRSETDSGLTHGYLVTARHCVEIAKPYGPLFLRINRRAESREQELADQVRDAELIEIEKPRWHYHGDETNDVAVLAMAPPSDQFMVFVTGPESMATKEVIAEEGIGIGDELMVVGLFTSH